MRTAEQKFKILRVLSNGKWERAEAIARETGLSKRLTTTLLKEMAADGLVDEIQIAARWALHFGTKNDFDSLAYKADAAFAFFRAVCKLACISPHMRARAAEPQ